MIRYVRHGSLLLTIDLTMSLLTALALHGVLVLIGQGDLWPLDLAHVALVYAVYFVAYHARAVAARLAYWIGGESWFMDPARTFVHADLTPHELALLIGGLSMLGAAMDVGSYSQRKRELFELAGRLNALMDYLPAERIKEADDFVRGEP